MSRVMEITCLALYRNVPEPQEKRGRSGESRTGTIRDSRVVGNESLREKGNAYRLFSQKKKLEYTVYEYKQLKSANKT